ncbi:Lysosome-associated membrane glycoprotein 1 [Merluccius polli]|uniref:Lysosome-associated membrane glycoprotein 5 n=1 Tax=Merluccius polli TaxID=89951 RepID=A0AA47MMP0_MERPO|nr:Lysosome-associated membrane glycoprotein 1 [Merluccius polli]
MNGSNLLSRLVACSVILVIRIRRMRRALRCSLFKVQLFLKDEVRCFCCFVLISISLCLGVARAVTLEVREGNSTCIKADLSASFSISYNTSNTSTTVQVNLPDSTTVDVGSSSCGSDGRPVSLVGVFGPGHTLGLFFSTNGSVYSVDTLSLQYNLSDSTLFPFANSSDVVTVMTNSVGMWARLNTTYRCVSPASIPVGGATVTFSGVRMEAYMTQEDLSPSECLYGRPGGYHGNACARQPDDDRRHQRHHPPHQAPPNKGTTP